MSLGYQVNTCFCNAKPLAFSDFFPQQKLSQRFNLAIASCVPTRVLLSNQVIWDKASNIEALSPSLMSTTLNISLTKCLVRYKI